jgi:uncharacterized membrane protein
MNTNVTAHDALVDNYLRAVGQALAGLPAYRRDELLQDLREHIAAGRAELGEDETEAEVRSLLDQLGDPADVAAEAQIDAPFAPLAPAPPMQLQPSKRVGAAVWVLIALGLCAMLCVGALLVGVFVVSSSSQESKTPAPAPIVTETPAPSPS